MTPPDRRATVEDLMRDKRRAELVAGRVVDLPLFGDGPAAVVGGVVASLHRFRGGGSVGMSKLAYVVPELPGGRESFSPAASYHTGPRPVNRMGPVLGPPTFAVELTFSNPDDVTDPADAARKRADYFAAGTLVVWDVDPVAGTIDCYRAADPLAPQRFAAGDTADAEPAVPGWRVAVDELMAEY